MFKILRKNTFAWITMANLLIALFWYWKFNFFQINLSNSINLNHPIIYLVQILFYLLLFFYFFTNTFWLKQILERWWGIERELSWPIAVMFLLYLLGFSLSLPIVAFQITPIYLLVILTFLTIILSGLNFYLSCQKSFFDLAMPSANLFSGIWQGKNVFKTRKKLVLIIIFALVIGLALLFQARTGEYIRSPWRKIHPLYLYGWLAIGFSLVVLAFSKMSLKKFLIFIILSSLLLHAYLLLPYESGFGGDKWRHLGAERWLMQGKAYEPTLFGQGAEWQEFGGIKVPRVLIIGNKTSYANMWGLTIGLSWLSGLDIFWIDLLLTLLLYSLFFPFLLLKIGSFFSKRKEFLSLLLFLPLCFYPLQAYGSITAPMSFAFLPFLFSLIFILRYLTNQVSKKHFIFGFIFLSIFLYFNYLLYLILFLEILLLSVWLKYFRLGQISPLIRTRKKVIVLVGLSLSLVIVAGLMPCLDTLNNYSWFKPDLEIGESWSMVKDFGQRLVTSKAIFPRTYRFEQDNWLYAQIGEDLSRSQLIQILPWALLLTPLVWLLILFGISRFKKLAHPQLGYLVAWMFLVLLINQGISTYLMDGNHIFSKRLVIFHTFLIVIILAWAIFQWADKPKHWILSRKGVVSGIAVFLALLLTTVYASGPKFQVVTKDEMKAAKYLWSEVKDNQDFMANPCILANTWPLLALEAESEREIISGGFPFYYEYRQPERTQLFDNMNTGPSLRYLEKALEVTSAKECYFMTEQRWILFDQRKDVVRKIDQILGEPFLIGEVMIWHYSPGIFQKQIQQQVEI